MGKLFGEYWVVDDYCVFGVVVFVVWIEVVCVDYVDVVVYYY